MNHWISVCFYLILTINLFVFSTTKNNKISYYEEKIDRVILDGNFDSLTIILEDLLEYSQVNNSNTGFGLYYYTKATIQMREVAYNLALNSLIKALNFYEIDNVQSKILDCQTQIGIIYYALKDYSKALNYFEKIILEVDNEKIKSGIHYLSGLCLTELNRNQEAEEYLTKALKSFEQNNSPKSQAECQVALAELYVRNNQNEKANVFYEKALDFFNDKNEVHGIAITNYGIGKIKKRKNELNEALNFTINAFLIADSISFFLIKEKSALQLSEIYKNIGFYDSAFTYLNIYYQTRDTIMSSDNLTAMSVLESELKLTQKQTEMELLKKQRQVDRFIIVAGILGLLLLIIVSASVYKMYKTEKKSRDLINIEKEKSDHLLLNILPKETSEELKEFGKTKARRYDNATVLFADIKGFTLVSEQVSPEKVVELIDQYFCAFDVICEKYKIEKIKTIGDAYLCVGGLPNPENGKPKDVIMAACEMQKVVLDINNNKSEDEPKFEIRVGLHTGSVVAGVVGKIKFAYDIWGDTVNTAARMEQSSVPGKINVSGVTYELTKNDFNFTYRGKIEAKNKGEIDMYFVNFEA